MLFWALIAKNLGREQLQDSIVTQCFDSIRKRMLNVMVAVVCCEGDSKLNGRWFEYHGVEVDYQVDSIGRNFQLSIWRYDLTIHHYYKNCSAVEENAFELWVCSSINWLMEFFVSTDCRLVVLDYIRNRLFPTNLRHSSANVDHRIPAHAHLFQFYSIVSRVWWWYMQNICRSNNCIYLVVWHADLYPFYELYVLLVNLSVERVEGLSILRLQFFA